MNVHEEVSCPTDAPRAVPAQLLSWLERQLGPRRGRVYLTSCCVRVPFALC